MIRTKYTIILNISIDTTDKTISATNLFSCVQFVCKTTVMDYSYYSIITDYTGVVTCKKGSTNSLRVTVTSVMSPWSTSLTLHVCPPNWRRQIEDFQNNLCKRGYYRQANISPWMICNFALWPDDDETSSPLFTQHVFSLKGH